MIQADITDATLYNNLRNEFKSCRATLRKSIREAKRSYYARIFDIYKHDIKKTWAVINEDLSHRSKRELHDTFVVDNRIITDSDEIAEKFNEYFINIGYNLSEKIQPARPFHEYLKDPRNIKFSFTPVCDNYIMSIISKLKNKSSHGHDNVSNHLIRRAKDVPEKSLWWIIP